MGFVLDVQNIMDANAVSEEIVFLKTTNCLSPKFVKYFTAGLIRFQSPLLKALRKCDKQPCRIGISTYAMYAAISTMYIDSQLCIQTHTCMLAMQRSAMQHNAV